MVILLNNLNILEIFNLLLFWYTVNISWNSVFGRFLKKKKLYGQVSSFELMVIRR